MEANLFICQKLIESLRGFDEEIKKSEKRLRTLLVRSREVVPSSIAQSNCTVYNAYLSIYSTRIYFDGIIGLNMSDGMQKNLETVKTIAKKVEDEFYAFYKEVKNVPSSKSIWGVGISDKESTLITDRGLTLCRKQLLLSSYLRQTEALLLVELSGKEPEIFENKYFREKDVLGITNTKPDE